MDSLPCVVLEHSLIVQENTGHEVGTEAHWLSLSRTCPDLLLVPYPGEGNLTAAISPQIRANLWRMKFQESADLRVGLTGALEKLNGWKTTLCFMAPLLLGLPASMAMASFLDSIQVHPGLSMFVMAGWTGVGLKLCSYADKRVAYLRNVIKDMDDKHPLRVLVNDISKAKSAGATISAELQAVLLLHVWNTDVARGLTQLCMDDRVALSDLSSRVQSYVDINTAANTELVLSGENSELLHRVVQAGWGVDLNDRVAAISTPKRVAL